MGIVSMGRPQRKDVIYQSPFLLNSGSEDMNVDGSVTPLNFDFAPSLGETFFVKSLTFLILDTGTTDPGDFGAITGALTNGLQFLIRSSGTEYEITNLKTNADIEVSLIQGIGSLPGNPAGWMNNLDWRSGKIEFNIPIRLDGDTSDYVRFKVRDDLTGIGQMCAAILIFRKI